MSMKNSSDTSWDFFFCSIMTLFNDLWRYTLMIQRKHNLFVTSYRLLRVSVCSSGHCLISWTATLSGSICDLAVRHSGTLRAPEALNMRHCISWPPPGPVTCSYSLVTSPCLLQRGNFPHSHRFYSTDTVSTLSAS